MMCILLARYSPDLFYWIQVRRIRRQFDRFGLLPNIIKPGLCLFMYKTNGLLVPWSIARYKNISFALWYRLCLEKRTNGIDGCLIIEFFRSSCKQLPCFWNDKATI